MIKESVALLVSAIVCSWSLLPGQEQGTTSQPPLQTFADLQTKDHDNEPFRIAATVLDIYHCPPCPPGAMCKPCIGDHIVATDNVDENDPHLIRRLRIFTPHPDQFELRKSYVFTVKIRGQQQQDRAIDQVDLLRFVEGGSTAATAPQITAANWQQHPQIKLVRAIVESIQKETAKGVFKTSQQKFEYCDSYEDTLRKLTVDGQGVARRYETQGGSDDSSLTTEHYYDSSGRVRFVFISGGAVNGSVLEHRIYFDETGKRIWEEHKYLKGPGYTFPEVWPDERLQISQPAAAFAAKSPCPAEKSKARKQTA
jgi:hypothetical protein